MTNNIHGLSAAAGAAFLGLVFLASGGVRGVPDVDPASTADTTGTLEIRGVPTPDDLVRLAKLDGDLPYVVPPGKVLVITRVGLKAASCNTIPQSVLGVERITFDGNCVWAFFHDFINGSFQYTYGTDLGTGIAAPAGTVIDLSGQAPADGQAVVILGFLADE